MGNQIGQVALEKRDGIRNLTLGVYDPLPSRDFFYSIKELEALFEIDLVGKRLSGPVRTRAKIAKSLVAQSLGFIIPKTFAKTQPRFPSQNLDVYVQQSGNLQIWNEDISLERRFLIIRVNQFETVTAVRVLTGKEIAALDKTGTLTSKFQAKRISGSTGSKLVSHSDTEGLMPHLMDSGATEYKKSTTASVPQSGQIVPISDLFDLLRKLEGITFKDPGLTQERVRGELAQKMSAICLGMTKYENYGQFPDIRSQALEIKLQTAATIDLGFVLPSDTIDAEGLGLGLKYSDCRYAIIYGENNGGEIRINCVVVTTGLDFFMEFRRLQGNGINRKLQIALPDYLFES